LEIIQDIAPQDGEDAAEGGDPHTIVTSASIQPATASVATPKRQRTYHAACRVCTSDKAPEVESLLAMGVTATAVAKRIGSGISADSVRRHWASHVPADRKASLIGKMVFNKETLDTAEKLEREKGEERDSLFLRLRAQRGMLWDLAKNSKSEKTRVQAHAILLKLTETIAKIIGEIQTGTNVSVTSQTLNVGGTDLFRLRDLIERTLAPYPAAQQALLSALAKESNAVTPR
jgi:hypothetical protein